MKEIIKEVICEKDIKGRTAANLVRGTSNFTGRIYCQKGTRKVNLRSLLGVLSLSIQKGDILTFYCEEEYALEYIICFLKEE